VTLENKLERSATGRPRRCGWLDLPALNYSSRISGITELAITKLDVLSGLDEIKVADSYDGDAKSAFPACCDMLDEVKPDYSTLSGWQDDITSAQSMDDLPETALQYLDYIEKQSGVPISMVSVGPKRSQTLVKQ